MVDWSVVVRSEELCNSEVQYRPMFLAAVTRDLSVDTEGSVADSDGHVSHDVDRDVNANANLFSFLYVNYSPVIFIHSTLLSIMNHLFNIFPTEKYRQ